MASLKEKLEAAGYDTTGVDENAILQKLDAAGYDVSSLGGAQAQPDWMNEPGLEDATMSTVKNLGTMTKSGISGISDLVAGNGLNQAAEDVGRGMEEKSAETKAGKVGSFIGGLVTPAQIAMQGALGSAVEASGLGEFATNILKGWSEKAATAAIGMTKSIAKSIGLDNIPALSKFLLSPVVIGEKTFAPIVEATSSPKQMLAAAEAIKEAAGAQLGKVSQAVDASIKAATEMGGEAPVAIDLAGLAKGAEALKADVANIAPNLGKAVINQYDNALLDINNLIKSALEGDSKTVFSQLSKLKTTIGDLVYKHGNPLESKAALNDVYHLISKTLSESAEKIGGNVGNDYAAANSIYHQVEAVVNALQGKAITAASKSFFNDVPAMLSALATSHAVAGPLGIIATPAAFLATKGAETYGPQVIAKGLDAAAPLIGSVLRGAVRSLPVVGNVISQALNRGE